MTSKKWGDEPPPGAFGAVRYRRDGQQYVATELGSEYRGTGETPHAAIRAYLDTVEEVNHDTES